MGYCYGRKESLRKRRNGRIWHINRIVVQMKKNRICKYCQKMIRADNSYGTDNWKEFWHIDCISTGETGDDKPEVLAKLKEK